MAGPPDEGTSRYKLMVGKALCAEEELILGATSPGAYYCSLESMVPLTHCPFEFNRFLFCLLFCLIFFAYRI